MVDPIREAIPDRTASPEVVARWMWNTLWRRAKVARAVLAPLHAGPDWDELPPDDRARRTASVARAMAAYCNPKLAARNCDLCGAGYRGPSIYCSLVCAVRDA